MKKPKTWAPLPLIIYTVSQFPAIITSGLLFLLAKGSKGSVVPLAYKEHDCNITQISSNARDIFTVSCDQKIVNLFKYYPKHVKNYIDLIPYMDENNTLTFAENIHPEEFYKNLKSLQELITTHFPHKKITTFSISAENSFNVSKWIEGLQQICKDVAGILNHSKTDNNNCDNQSFFFKSFFLNVTGIEKINSTCSSLKYMLEQLKNYVDSISGRNPDIAKFPDIIKQVSVKLSQDYSASVVIEDCNKIQIIIDSNFTSIDFLDYKNQILKKLELMTINNNNFNKAKQLYKILDTEGINYEQRKSELSEFTNEITITFTHHVDFFSSVQLLVAANKILTDSPTVINYSSTIISQLYNEILNIVCKHTPCANSVYDVQGMLLGCPIDGLGEFLIG